MPGLVRAMAATAVVSWTGVALAAWGTVRGAVAATGTVAIEASPAGGNAVVSPRASPMPRTNTNRIRPSRTFLSRPMLSSSRTGSQINCGIDSGPVGRPTAAK